MSTTDDLRTTIEAADRAIEAENFDALMDFYTDDAALVVKPGLIARGKDKIGLAFVAIAEHFNHSLAITQPEMVVLDGGDTALVLAEAILRFANEDGSSGSITRRATYVFKREANNKWLCVIDNSYGTDLLDGQ